MFNVLVIEIPCLAVFLCQFEECTLSLQWVDAQICLGFAHVTEERPDFVLENLGQAASHPSTSGRESAYTKYIEEEIAAVFNRGRFCGDVSA